MSIKCIHCRKGLTSTVYSSLRVLGLPSSVGVARVSCGGVARWRATGGHRATICRPIAARAPGALPNLTNEAPIATPHTRGIREHVTLVAGERVCIFASPWWRGYRGLPRKYCTLKFFYQLFKSLLQCRSHDLHGRSRSPDLQSMSIPEGSIKVTTRG